MAGGRLERAVISFAPAGLDRAAGRSGILYTGSGAVRILCHTLLASGRLLFTRSLFSALLHLFVTVSAPRPNPWSRGWPDSTRPSLIFGRAGSTQRDGGGDVRSGAAPRPARRPVNSAGTGTCPSQHDYPAAAYALPVLGPRPPCGGSTARIMPRSATRHDLRLYRPGSERSSARLVAEAFRIRASVGPGALLCPAQSRSTLQEFIYVAMRQGRYGRGRRGSNLPTQLRSNV